MNRRKSDLLFILVILCVALLYGYHNIFFHHPSYHHLWRQSDCLSITMNYYMDDRNFFEPAIHLVGEKAKDGRTISEFPIIYFSVAQLWKIFGHHEFIFRLINVLIVFSGLFCLYRFARELLGDTFWAILIPIFLFTSPVLGFYTNSFLADAPALGLAMIAGYFFWKAFSLEKKRWYWISFLFFLLAGLIKLSSLMIFFAFLIIQVYILIFRRKEKSWFNQVSLLIPYFVVAILIFAWYSYVRYYNSHNIAGLFLQGILPIWAMDSAARSAMWTSLHKEMLPAFFSGTAALVNLLIFFSLVILIKKVNKYLFWLNILIFLGGIAFILLFFQVFNVHDYYLTNLLIFMPLPGIALLEMLKRNYPRIFRNVIFKGVIAVLVGILVYTASVQSRMKYYPHQPYVQKSLFISDDMKTRWVMWVDYCSKFYQPLETINPYLRELGIKRNDLVYCTPDVTINASLYLMDQKGFTDFYFGSLPEEERFAALKNQQVQYLVLLDTTFHRNPKFAPFLKRRIGTYKTVEIWDLR
jgi:4-amino-4-deoxy-L-arabinose transferase-like glycosyltransferase